MTIIYKSLPFYLPPWVKPKTKLCLSAKLAIIPSSALAVSTTVGRMSSQAKFFDSKTEEGHGELCVRSRRGRGPAVR